MKDQKLKGSIVNISSIGATNGAATHSHYCASKAGVIGYTKTMAQEFGPFGIRVNAVLPGVINTPMVERNGGDEVLNFFFHFVSIMAFHATPFCLIAKVFLWGQDKANSKLISALK